MPYIYDVILTKQEIGILIDAMLTKHPNEWVSLTTMLDGIHLTMANLQEKSKILHYVRLTIVHEKKD